MRSLWRDLMVGVAGSLIATALLFAFSRYRFPECMEPTVDDIAGFTMLACIPGLAFGAAYVWARNPGARAALWERLLIVPAMVICGIAVAYLVLSAGYDWPVPQWVLGLSPWAGAPLCNTTF